MKINEYILQQKQQNWNSNKHNKLLEIKPTLEEWKQGYRKNWKEIILSRLCIGHTRITHSYLKQSSNQCVMHARSNTLKYTVIECIDLANLRKTFYSAKDMKELFQNIEIKNVIRKSNEYMQKI